MTLSMTLGMTIGIRKTFWMMAGELVGVGLVVVLTQIGVAAILLTYPALFIAFKWGGGLYLAYLGYEMWRSRGRLAIQEKTDVDLQVSEKSLIFQGFITAVANPKGWAFFIALLPPFVDQNSALAPQLMAFLVIILSLEFVCLVLYALGGQSLSHLLRKRDNVRMMNRFAGTLMVGVGIWLILG